MTRAQSDAGHGEGGPGCSDEVSGAVRACNSKTGHVDRRILKTRAAIQAAFRKLIKERGLAKVTVSALAREADIDRKTFYLHYESIDDLLNTAADRLISRVLARLDACEDCATPRDRIRDALDEVRDILLEDVDLFAYFATNLSLDVVSGHISHAVERYVEEHPVYSSVLSGQRAAYLMHFYLVGAVSAYSMWLQSDREVSIDWVCDVVADTLAMGWGEVCDRAGDA